MTLPRVYRPVGEPRLHLRMPYQEGGNRRWIHTALGSRIQPVWNKAERRWEIARTHLLPLVDALAEEFGEVLVELEFSTTQQCDTRCRNAEGDHCECSCLGEHHGGGLWGGWLQVGETTLIRPDRVLRQMVVRRGYRS